MSVGRSLKHTPVDGKRLAGLQRAVLAGGCQHGALPGMTQEHPAQNGCSPKTKQNNKTSSGEASSSDAAPERAGLQALLETLPRGLREKLSGGAGHRAGELSAAGTASGKVQRSRDGQTLQNSPPLLGGLLPAHPQGSADPSEALGGRCPRTGGWRCGRGEE